MNATQDKASERGYYDELFSRRKRFDQFSAAIYDRLSSAAKSVVGGGRVLDIGCGSGTQALSLTRHGFSVVALDLSIEAVRVARQTTSENGASVPVVNADAEHLPIADQSVDACVCSLLLHHFSELGPIADELKRVLRPGGVVVSMDANAHNPFAWLFFNAYHRIRKLERLTPNQRALWSGEIRRVFGERGFTGFQFDSFSSDLRRDWLGASLGARLNYETRRAVLGMSRLVLPRVAQGNMLMAVFQLDGDRAAGR